ncbi:LysM peptidoglycan-binding domain-containing protein [Desulfolucanica intricata]|uniref:LysM peptidoglycan-binding domain-containing protein n=1 Tax=Desulfolucanica intricata TaxID=1285191 RepID=UPI000833CBEA|nr:LysM peptidoglycan-binding domain-containing protein [Desulfolucanica intricata]
MKFISFLLVLCLAMINLVGCGEVEETREKTLPDGSKIIVDTGGKILTEEKVEPLEGYTYDEDTGRYINETTGIWYVVENGQKIIPSEEYFDRDKVVSISGIGIADRPNDVWELKEVREITIQSGDTLVDVINPYFMNEHFRMNYEWYAKQVLEINNITDPNIIKAGDTLKIPIYIDKGVKNLTEESAGDNHENKNMLSKEEIIQLVESIDPYQLKPAMTPKERYDLRTEIYSKIPKDKIHNFSHAIQSSALQLYGIVSDDRYIELIDKNHPRWDAYDENNLFGIVTVLSGVEKYVDYKPLQEDIDAVKKLCNEGLKERNILKIIDANRILQDLSRHLIRVPYRGEEEEKVDYGDIHNLYFKATKTLEGAHNFLSDNNIPTNNNDYN